MAEQLRLFKYTCGTDDRIGAAKNEEDAYERRAEVDPTFHFLPVTITEMTMPGYEIVIRPSGADPEQLSGDVLATMREMVRIQGEPGNWDHDSYALGMYNGMELQLATAEGREPVYREAPEEWLADRIDPPAQPDGDPENDADASAQLDTENDANAPTDEFDAMDKSALQAWLTEREVKFHKQTGEPKLREQCRATVAAAASEKDQTGGQDE